MAIIKRNRKSGVRYQVKEKGSDGRWITATFDRLADAEKKEAELRVRKRGGLFVTNLANQVTVTDYFRTWDQETKGRISKGWRETQVQMFRAYVGPVIGNMRLQTVTPAMIGRVLRETAEKGRGPSVQTHVYNLLHKMFEDAVELFEMLQRNPVLTKLRPRVLVKESRYLKLDQIGKLLAATSGKTFETAVWLQLFAGLRVGEVQALTWSNVNLDQGMIHVRATYVRREKRFQDYPKGRRWHSIKMPPELWEHLRRTRIASGGLFVVQGVKGEWLDYHGYATALERYCKEAEVPRVSTHGLRHSTSELYMAHGATRDDLRILFAHSSGAVTDRYVHDKGERLDEVAKVIRLFPNGGNQGQVSPKFPREGKSGELVATKDEAEVDQRNRIEQGNR
jgi:integrase